MLAGRQVSLEFRGHDRKPGVIYFPTNWGAKEPQNLPNHRVDESWRKLCKLGVGAREYVGFKDQTNTKFFSGHVFLKWSQAP